MPTAALIVATVICGCGCQVPFDTLVARDKGCSHLISLTEHLFALFASLPALRQPRRLPLRLHAGLALGQIGFTQMHNVALGTALPSIVVTVLKNGGLVANMFLGVFLLRRRYTPWQHAAVLIITVGLVLTSLSGSKTAVGSGATGLGAIVGIACLTGAVFSRASSGIVQECCCKKYAPAVQEILLFRALMGLPPILLQWDAIKRHASSWSLELWMLLAADLVFDFATKICMTRLVERASALTANLVLTGQKFASFCILAAWTQKTSCKLWLGALAVLLGTLLFANAPKPVDIHAKRD